MYNQLNDSHKEMENLKDKIKYLEQLLNVQPSNAVNSCLYKQLRMKMDNLNRKMNNQMGDLFENIIQPATKPQKLMSIARDIGNSSFQIRKRAISTDTSDKRDTSLFIHQQAITLQRKVNQTRYEIQNEFNDNIIMATAKADYGRIERIIQQSQPKKEQLKQQIFNLNSRESLNVSRTRCQDRQFKFIIKDGVRLNCFELISLRNQYQQDWTLINAIIKRLEDINKRYKCPLFFVDGKSVIRLYQRNRMITLSDLLQCIHNKEDVQHCFEGKLFNGPDGMERAATKIQSLFKTMYQRRKFREVVRFMKQARQIQRRYRSYRNRQRTRKVIQQRNILILNEFKERQTEFKEQWEQIVLQPRVEIHINSMCCDEYTRLSMDKFLQRENSQLGRIFRGADQNITVLYVSPYEIGSEIMQYYEKLFNITNHKFQVKVVVPENGNKFPTHMSLLQKLLYSPKCLKQIQKFIGQQCAYIVPGYPSNEYVKLCNILNVPLYGGYPQNHLLYSCKSASQILFSQSQLQTSPGASEIFEEVEMMNTLTVLIIKNKNIKVWIFKIDNTFNGRGLATLNVNHINGLRLILDSNEEQDELSISTIKYVNPLDRDNQLKANSLIDLRLQSVNSFLSSGGVIEAQPPVHKSQIKSIGVIFEVQPNYEYEMLTTYDSHHGQSYVQMLQSFPSQYLHKDDATEIVSRIAKFLRQRSMIGQFTLNLIGFDDNLWAIGIDCYYSGQHASYQCYKLLNNQQNAVFTIAPHVCHPGLITTQLTTFFHNCRMENISYDITLQWGQSFMFIDILQQGLFQMIALGNTFTESVELLELSFKMLFKLAGTVNVNYGESIYESRSDPISILDVYGVLKYILKRQIT